MMVGNSAAESVRKAFVTHATTDNFSTPTHTPTKLNIKTFYGVCNKVEENDQQILFKIWIQIQMLILLSCNKI